MDLLDLLEETDDAEEVEAIPEEDPAEVVRVFSETFGDITTRLETCEILFVENFGFPVMCDGCNRRRLCHIFTANQIPLYLCRKCSGHEARFKV